ncbi:cytochrome P450 family protein [Streptomyces peucetius]|uniref:Cytochrome P450 n=1 Tax=Streptomyces peucetius TaxID=1950 RepID=A0ABY6HZY4_STRPE|nr:cytochrome P450 [Streptomyces peucetius]UYQ60288.1 cytochrome P450 [Streptomyces peucetius]
MRVELPGGVAAWAATDHATAQKVLGHEALTKDPAHWPDLNAGRIRDDWELIALVRGAAMLHEGGSEHRRLRQLVSTAFARAPIEALRPRIEQIAAELLDDLLATGTTGPVDLREHFAYPLPVRVICEVLGVPDTTVSELRHRFDRLVTPRKNASGEEDIRVAQMDIVSSLTALIEAKRSRPGDDLTTALIQARDESDRLSQRELVETLFLVLIAGHETTINSITNTAHALLQNPAVLTAVLQAEDSDAAWEAAVEEGLRYASPVRHALLRYAVKDVEIAGVTIARGEPVLASLAAAGRDTTRHENPDRFDVARSTRREHLAFGFGAHFCLGARLAKLETKIALRALFTRFPALALAEEPARLSSIPLQGYSTLPVRLQSRPVLPDPERGCPADAAPGDA